MPTTTASAELKWDVLVTNRQGLVRDPDGRQRPGGILYRAGIAKISAFSRACNDDGIPLVWLQDISGFDIGREAEAPIQSKSEGLKRSPPSLGGARNRLCKDDFGEG